MPKVMTIGQLPYRRTPLPRHRMPFSPTRVIGPTDLPRMRGIRHFALGAALPAVEPEWRTDWRMPPVTTPQEPQNLLRPTNKGCPGCFGALRAGAFQGRLPNRGLRMRSSQQGKLIRCGIQGLALGSAGLGFSVGDALCAGGSAATATQSTYSWDTGTRSTDDFLNAATQVFGVAAQTACRTDSTTSTANLEQQSQQTDLATRREIERLRLQNEQLALMSARQPAAPTPAIAPTTLYIAGAAAIGLVAVVLLLR